MPGATEAEAISNYVLPIQHTLRCVTDTPLAFLPSEAFRLLVLDARMPGAQLNGSQLKLSFTQGFSPIQKQDGTWKVRTEAYVYILTDEQNRPMVTYDWHPHRDYLRQRPHFHIKHGAAGQGTSGIRSGLKKVHFPSGRIAIEEIVRFLITDMGVCPRCSDWDSVLSNNLDKFESHRSWS